MDDFGVNQDLDWIIEIRRPPNGQLMIDNLSLPLRNRQSTISEAMEIHIRKAGVEDLKHILHHRRAMFDEMGFRDTAVLNCVEDLSREDFSEGLLTGTYRGWLVEGWNGPILGGGGVVTADWPCLPGENQAHPAYTLHPH